MRYYKTQKDNVYWEKNEFKLRCEIQVVEHHSRDMNTNTIILFIIKLIGKKQNPRDDGPQKD